MLTAKPGTIDYRRRSANGCLCCGTPDLYSETTVISPFLARRAMDATPSLTRVLFCGNCGIRFFDRGLSEREAERYYRGYRNDEYCTTRNRYEPFYTTRVHRELAAWLGSVQRRQALAQVLAQCGGIDGPRSILDFGGGDGALIADLDSAERVVLDPSETPPVSGVDRISDAACTERQWDLIVCAQVLEHLSDPRQTVDQLGSLLAQKGLLYLEVPDEIWGNRTYPGPGRDRWLGWLVTRPALLVAGDIASTACRIKLGTLPPFGFIPMREHLQYFTENSLRAMIHACGLHVVQSGRNAVGQIYAVAAKRPHGVP
jgi:hypothetical protein